MLDILNLASIVLNAYIARLIYKYSKNIVVNKYFINFIIFISLWQFFIFLMFAYPANADLLGRLSMFFVIIGYYYLVLFNNNIVNVDKKFFKYTFWIPLIFCYLILFTKTILVKFIVVNKGLQIINGPLVVVYSLYYLLFVFQIFYKLFKEYISVQPALKARISSQAFLVFCIFTAFFTFSEILPVYIQIDYSMKIAPLGSYILAIVSAFSILRYQLFDIKIIFKEAIFYSGLFTLFLLAFLGLAYILGISVFNNIHLTFMLMFLAIISTSIMQQKLKLKLIKLINKDKLPFDDAIKYINNTLVNILETGRLKNKIKKLIDDLFKPIKKELIVFDNPIMDKKYNEIKVYFWDDKDCPKKYTKGKYDVVLNLVIKERILGFIYLKLDIKYLNYTKENIDLMNIFAHTISIALSNAQSSEENKLKQSLLFQSEKLAAVGQTVSGLVHELKNPLTGIKLGLNNIRQILKQKGMSDKDIDDILNQSANNIENLHEHLKNFLDFSKKDELNMVEADVNTIIQKAHFFVAEQLEQKKIKFIFQEKPGIELKCDSKKIQQVLLNLFLNAINAMEAGGKLEVILKPLAPLQGERGLGKGVCIVISDNGPGIPKKDLAKIFDPFYTSKKEGTGMGLAVSKEIVELHGGKIEVESKPGQGTSFILSFPI